LVFSTSFEGILGLGIPLANRIHSLISRPRRKTSNVTAAVAPAGFLEQAGVDRFSICFDGGSNGALRLGSPQLVESHASVGVNHWGLGMHGMSIGTSNLPLPICSMSSMRNDQETPCGAIPDSGTTMITGPKAQLSVLFDAICDAWPRCKQNLEIFHVKDPDVLNVSMSPKELALKLLLADCTGLGELPDLHFHIAGAGGTAQTLSLPGNSYVFETYLGKNGSFADNPFQRTEGMSKMCVLAFQEKEYDTLKNGPVWVFGSPFFHEYQVGYDMGTKPPSMSFASVVDHPCGTCDKQTGLITSDTSRAFQSVRLPRWLPGAPREPRIDVNQPL